MSVILKTPSNGSVTVSPADTASDVVVTVPAVTATLLNNSSGVLNIGSGQIYKDAAGNLGLGVTPSAWGTDFSQKAFQVGNVGSLSSLYVSSSNLQTNLACNVYDFTASPTYISAGAALAYRMTSSGHAWYTAPSGTAGNAISFTQAMTLDTSGNLLVGTTSNGRQDVNSITLEPKVSGGGYGVFNHATGTASGRQFIDFAYAANQIGTITQNGTTAVAYNTTSDYRLKENVQPMQNALATVAALKPCTYTWKADGSAGQGFIAHELQAVVPDCVTGEKDAVRIVDELDDEGKVIGTKEEPQYQGVDTSFLIATLTAAIQEQQAIITQLQADVAALKGAA
jgi:hypothetical protein